MVIHHSITYCNDPVAAPCGSWRMRDHDDCLSAFPVDLLQRLVYNYRWQKGSGACRSMRGRSQYTAAARRITRGVSIFSCQISQQPLRSLPAHFYSHASSFFPAKREHDIFLYIQVWDKVIDLEYKAYILPPYLAYFSFPSFDISMPFRKTDLLVGVSRLPRI